MEVEEQEFMKRHVTASSTAKLIEQRLVTGSKTLSVWLVLSYTHDQWERILRLAATASLKEGTRSER